MRCVFHCCCKKQPIRVTDVMIFVLNQSQIDTKRPINLDADQIGGAFTNKTTEFYIMNVNLMKKEIWPTICLMEERQWWKSSIEICDFTKREDLGRNSGRYWKGHCSYTQTSQTQRNKNSKAPEDSSRKTYLSWIWTSITTVMFCSDLNIYIYISKIFIKSLIHHYLIYGQHWC